MKFRGNTLEDIITSQHLTNSELADIVGVTTRQIRNWLRDKSHPNGKHLKRLDELLSYTAIEEEYSNGYLSSMRLYTPKVADRKVTLDYVSEINSHPRQFAFLVNEEPPSIFALMRNRSLLAQCQVIKSMASRMEPRIIEKTETFQIYMTHKNLGYNYNLNKQVAVLGFVMLSDVPVYDQLALCNDLASLNGTIAIFSIYGRADILAVWGGESGYHYKILLNNISDVLKKHASQCNGNQVQIWWETCYTAKQRVFEKSLERLRSVLYPAWAWQLQQEKGPKVLTFPAIATPFFGGDEATWVTIHEDAAFPKNRIVIRMPYSHFKGGMELRLICVEDPTLQHNIEAHQEPKQQRQVLEHHSQAKSVFFEED